MQYPNHQPTTGPGVPSFPPPPPSHPPLPPGWEQATDPATGRHYYANRSTGETSWTPPPYFPPPPPPPPAPVLQPPPPHPQEQQINQHFHQSHAIEQPQMMYTSAQPAIAQPIAQPVAHIVPGHNILMPSNYSPQPQQYAPNQTQLMETTPSHVQTLPLEQHQQQQESQPASTPSSSLDPSVALAPGMLVPTVRAMINEEYTRKTATTTTQSSSVPKLELEGLSAGAIADLCNVSKELKSRNVDGGDFAGDTNNTAKQGGGDDDAVDQYYAPLQPFALPVSSIPPHIEPGRVDIRLHALHSKLNKI